MGKIQKKLGEKLLNWYLIHGRDLPFRQTKDPYKIWICEIIFQQTRIQQGISHYQKFVERFPDVSTLHQASEDEVLLYWKGLGYYSRAINLHKAAHQILEDFGGRFPENFEDILKLKGVGKYTAAAISSICFNEKIPAVDGNFYRVLSRVFADETDISSQKAFKHFSELALKMMPEKNPGNFNEAMMDLGSEICTPKNPKCTECPLNTDCIAFELNIQHNFPVKLSKVKTSDETLDFYFLYSGGKFLIRQRDNASIWKKLFEFPTELPDINSEKISPPTVIKHKLTHKNLTIRIATLKLSEKKLVEFAFDKGFSLVDFEDSKNKTFPKPLQRFLEEIHEVQ